MSCTHKMKKALSLLLTAFTFFIARSQEQTILLFTEDFDPTQNNWVFDSVGPTGNNFGNNDWIINDAYNGWNLYPNTPNEDSTDGGLIINNAPYSNYLHIHDVAAEAAGTDSNDNWNPVSGSDRFCYIGQTFCTLGLTSVQFTFDWICVGSPEAYGQVYFRSGTGPWTQIGLPKYNSQGDWIYESIEDARLANKANIQIGFRWVDPGTGGAYDAAFGIDDIFAVGNYNPADTTGMVTISTQVLDTQICQGGQVQLFISLSSSLCDGNYEIELSNKYGQFDDPYNIGVFEAGPEFLQTDITTLPTDDQLLGNCFKVRIVRTGPPPSIISDTTACIQIMACPNAIFNTVVPVLNDADTTCILSEVDVMFNSIGVFNGNNTYYAQLSDSAGSFSNPTQLGTLPSSDSFPSLPPGDISGVIPASVVPGCDYYLRVISSNPPTVGDTLGPFCLKDCDILTNNITDLHFCVGPHPYPYASCDTINIKDHYWNGHVDYDTCNNWEVELRKMSDFSLINFGGLAIYHDTSTGNFVLCIDSLPPSISPGEYYMRISSTCSVPSTDSTGTVIRITIGEPVPTAPDIFVVGNDSICPGNPSPIIIVDPFNSPPSTYLGYGSLFGPGDTIIWPYPELQFNIPAGFSSGTYNFMVQEVNYGCYGPGSAPAYITVLPGPLPEINGPTVVCLGDSAQFNVSFLDETYYVWTATPGSPNAQILDVSNVQTTVDFDSVGTYTISNFSLNTCGEADDSLIVTVTPGYIKLNSGPDTTLCLGDSIHINANPTPVVKNFQVQDTGSSIIQGGMFNLVAHTNLTIDSFGLFLYSAPPFMQAQVYGKQGTYLGFEQNPSAWQLLAQNDNNVTQLVGQFTTIEAEIGHVMAPGDSFAFYVTTTGTPVLDVSYGAGNGPQGTVYSSNGDLDFVQGTVLDYAFKNNLTGQGYILDVLVYYSTYTGLTYAWSNGDTTSGFVVTPKLDTSYSVLVTNHGQCSVRDTVNIKVAPVPTVNAGPDTSVCPNQPYVMQGSSTTPNVTFLWNPTTGLNSATNPNAIFNYNDSVAFVLTVTDSSGHCKNKSGVDILVPLRLSVGPDTTICQGDLDTLQAATTGQSIIWSPGSGLNDSTILNPVFNSTGSSGETFTITATDKEGCKLSGTVQVAVENCTGKIVAPSAFTPTYSGNGTGASDDHFIVWGRNIKEYEVRIYNRWGELVYDSGMMGELDDNFSPPLWDGKYKGKLQDTGTFEFYITATTDVGKNIFQKGNVTLIR